MTPWRVGIVGSEAAKFTPETEAKAKAVIRGIIEKADSNSGAGVTVVSGGCHLGGIDIWAAEIGADAWCKVEEYKPKTLQWSTGYKPRNLEIARRSDEVHCITVEKLPASYKGMRFETCYHCARWAPDAPPHIKSGGCWTMHKHAQTKFGVGYLWIIKEGKCDACGSGGPTHDFVGCSRPAYEVLG